MKKVIVISSLLAIALLVVGCGPSEKLTVIERQELIVDMETETLQELYEHRPATKEKINNAAGYAVFANGNVNIIFVSAGGGYGVVTNKSTGQKTYMKMAMGGVGLGVGAKDYRQVLIFNAQWALDKFIESGWEFGGHADAAAKAGQSGGAVGEEGAIGEQVEVYAMTESGLALQATVTGTKYWKNQDLN